MNFALLGEDSAMMPLVAALAGQREQQLTHAALTGDSTSKILPLVPAVRVVQAWDELLMAPELDTIVVAGSESDVLEGARQLAAAGKSLLVFPSSDQGATWVYELSLIRDDTNIILLPLFATRLQPKLRQLRQSIDSGAIGKVLHLQIECELHSAGPAGLASLLTVAETEEALLGDVDLLRFLGGNYHRVTALYSGAVDEKHSLATITLAGDDLPEALWSITGTADNPRWILTVTGEKGKLLLARDSDAETWHLCLNDDELPSDSDEAAFDLGEALLQHCSAALSAKAVRPDWIDLTRALEICEGTRRSIRRRRTIDLHFESTSERSQFKTQMTAVGCSLLSLTLLAVVFVLIAGVAFDPRETVEVKAERADSILDEDDFLTDSAELTSAGRERLEEIADRMHNTSFPVLIEQVDIEKPGPLNDDRRTSIVRMLEAAQVPGAAERTIVAPVEGRGFHWLMKIARIAVFVPLGLFLLLQLLLLITRPSSEETKE